MEHVAQVIRRLVPNWSRKPAGRELAERYLTVRWARPRSGIAVYTAIGEVDLLTAPLLEHALDTGDPDGAVASVVDLTQVEFLGLAGLRVLYRAAARATLHERWFAVVADTYEVIRVLDLLGLDQEIALYGSLPQAFQAADRSTGPLVRR